MKKLKLLLMSTLMTVSMSLTALAGAWQQDAKGWWYQNDDGTYPVSAWQWIDGNGDGIAESYYFDAEGYCLMNGAAPGGLTVNADGAWTVDGVVQTRPVSSGTQQTAPDSKGSVSQPQGSVPQTPQIPETAAEPVGTTVWLSRTGSKYHSTPTCSNMKNPIKSTRDEAIAQGREACSKCW